MIRSLLVAFAMSAALALACGDADVHQQSAATNTPDTSYKPPSIRETLTAIPAGKLRDDCLTDWFALATNELSVCFPRDWEVSTTEHDPGLSGRRTYSIKGTGLFIGVSLKSETPVSSGTVPSLEAFCEQLASAQGIAFAVREYELADRVAEGCVGEGDAGEGGVNPTYLFATLGDARYVQFYITRDSGEQGVDTMLRAVLGTLPSQ